MLLSENHTSSEVWEKDTFIALTIVVLMVSFCHFAPTSGTLVYTPPIGACLPPGRHKIDCEFVSDTPQNVLPSTMSMSVEVVKRPPKIVWEVDPMTGQLKATKQKN